MSTQSSSHPAAGDVVSAQGLLEQLADGRPATPDVTALVASSDEPGSTFDDVFGLDY